MILVKLPTNSRHIFPRLQNYYHSEEVARSGPIKSFLNNPSFTVSETRRNNDIIVNNYDSVVCVCVGGGGLLQEIDTKT